MILRFLLMVDCNLHYKEKLLTYGKCRSKGFMYDHQNVTTLYVLTFGCTDCSNLEKVYQYLIIKSVPCTCGVM